MSEPCLNCWHEEIQHQSELVKGRISIRCLAVNHNLGVFCICETYIALKKPQPEDR